MASTVQNARGRQGVPLLVRRWPAAGEPKAAALIVHGLAEHSGRYDRTASILAASGFEVSAFDLQGFGGSGGRRAFVAEWETWLSDIEDRLADAHSSVGDRPVVLLGHSMGGLVALTYALSERPPPDLLVLSSPWLADHQPEWRRISARILGRLVPTLSVANGFDGSTLSRDPQVGVDYLADPLAHHRTTAGLGRQVLAAQKRALASLDRLRTPTLVTHGGADPLVPTASTEILGGLPAVDRKVYPDLRHETLNEPEGPQVAADICAWIGAHLEGLEKRPAG